MIVNHRPDRNGRAVAAPSVIANDGSDDRVVGRARPVHRMIDDRVVARSGAGHRACPEGAAAVIAVTVMMVMIAVCEGTANGGEQERARSERGGEQNA